MKNTKNISFWGYKCFGLGKHIWALIRKKLSLGFENQLVHLHSLISQRLHYSLIGKYHIWKSYKQKFNFLAISVAEQACLGMTWSETPKTGFLISEAHIMSYLFISNDYMFLYPLFSLEKKGILISCQSRSVVRPCIRPSITFLVNVSPPKPLEVATLNFVVE